MRRRAAEGRQSMRALFQNVDGLLYPPATGEAPEGLLDSGSAQFGALWSLMHLPCVSVPMATGPAGLPMGVQVIGMYGDDERVLAVAEFVGTNSRNARVAVSAFPGGALEAYGSISFKSDAISVCNFGTSLKAAFHT